MVITYYDVDTYNLTITPTKDRIARFKKYLRYLFYFLLLNIILLFLFALFSQNYLIIVFVFVNIVESFIVILFLLIAIAINHLNLLRFQKLLSIPFYLEIKLKGEIVYKYKSKTKIITGISSYNQQSNSYLLIKGINSSYIKIPKFIKDYERFIKVLSFVINNNQLNHNIFKKALSNYLDNNNFNILFEKISNLDYLLPYNDLNPLENSKVLIDPITNKEMILETIEKEKQSYICIYSNIEELDNISYKNIKKINFETLFELINATEFKSVLFNNQNFGIVINKNSDKIYINPIKEELLS